MKENVSSKCELSKSVFVDRNPSGVVKKVFCHLLTPYKNFSFWGFYLRFSHAIFQNAIDYCVLRSKVPPSLQFSSHISTPWSTVFIVKLNFNNLWLLEDTKHCQSFSLGYFWRVELLPWVLLLKIVFNACNPWWSLEYVGIFLLRT